VEDSSKNENEQKDSNLGPRIFEEKETELKTVEKRTFEPESRAAQDREKEPIQNNLQNNNQIVESSNNLPGQLPDGSDKDEEGSGSLEGSGMSSADTEEQDMMRELRRLKAANEKMRKTMDSFDGSSKQNSDNMNQFETMSSGSADSGSIGSAGSSSIH
jgi:hypothetical protein